MASFRHDERARGYAREAYQALEPLHLVAYFSPAVRDVSKDRGLGFYPSYMGFRGAPLGACDASVVASAFYNWNPEVVTEGWSGALEKYTTAELLAAREEIADKSLTEAFGDLATSDALLRLVDRFTAILSKADHGGRPLGAANLALGQPELPHVALWQATTTLREWRGDGHIAALVVNGLDPVEALVFHEADNPNPDAKPGMGRAQTQKSRSWSDEQWAEAADNLRSRGLMEADAERLTAQGAELYQLIEDQTDDASAGIWADVTDADEVFAAARPFVKSVIDAGFLPGSPKK